MSAQGSDSGRMLHSGVFVIGMHRSGTSALTGVLTALGLNPGGPLLGANESNAKGHFELISAVEHNERLLKTLGRKWSDVSAMPEDWWLRPDVLDQLPDAVAIITDLAARGRWVLKDPRICLLLPHWLEACDRAGVDVSCVVALRNPADVASSLMRRDGIPLAMGALMWVRHLGAALTAMRNRVRAAVVCVEELMVDWRSSMASVLSELDLAPEAAGREIDAFLEPALFRTSSSVGSAEGLELRLGQWYASLRRSGNIDELAHQFWAGAESGVVASVLDASLSLAVAEVARRSERIAELESLRLGLVEDAVQSAVANAASRSEALVVHVAKADAVNHELNQDLRAARQDLEVLRQQLMEATSVLASERQQAASRESSFLRSNLVSGEHLASALSASTGALAERVSQISSAVDQALAALLESSRSQAADSRERISTVAAALSEQVRESLASALRGLDGAKHEIGADLESIESSVRALMQAVEVGRQEQLARWSAFGLEVESLCETLVAHSQDAVVRIVEQRALDLSSRHSDEVEALRKLLVERLAKLEAENHSLVSDRDAIAVQLRQREMEHLRDRDSLSWRITAPLRWMDRMLSWRHR